MIKDIWKSIIKNIFYKSEQPLHKIKTRSIFIQPKTAPTPGTFTKSFELSSLMVILFAFVGMILSSSIAFSINTKFFPLPPAIEIPYKGEPIAINSSSELHLAAWTRLAFYNLTAPVHLNKTEEELYQSHKAVMQYKYYESLVSKAGYGYVITVRQFFVGLITLLFTYIGFCNSFRFIRSVDVIIETEGAKIFEGEEAERELKKFWKPAYLTFEEKITKFANLGVDIYHPEDQRRQHTFIVGNSGSGKSQVLYPLIKASIDKGLKTVILDPKSEWTKHFFDENDPSIALIDPTDARSHQWSFMRDLRGLGFIISFVASVIPSGNSKDPMWTNAARMVNVALFLFIKKTFGDKATFKDVADVVQLKDEKIAYIVNKFYPHAARLVGDLKGGELEQNQTVSGIMINMISFMEYFMDLARFWNKPSEKTLSLYEFMTNPDYPIKTIIIRPNESESRMARGITANILAYMMNFIKKPELYGSSELPVGNFFLDEFQSPGKLEDENNDPVLQTVIQQGRSLGWAVYFATQTIDEAERIYGKEVIAGWRGTIGTQILAGSPTGSLQPWIDGFGDKKIQKRHDSISIASNGDVSYSSNWQEHIAKVILPTTLAEKLNNEPPWVKFLIIPVGAQNLYFLRKKYYKITANYPSYIAAKESENILDKNSRVLIEVDKMVNSMKDNTLSDEKTHIESLEKEYEDDDVDFNDYGQYADKEESYQTQQYQEEYDITPDEQENDSIINDVAKEQLINLLTDTHAISTIATIYELLINKKPKVKTKSHKEKMEFDFKNRYKKIL